jgi:hypothetical protein
MPAGRNKVAQIDTATTLGAGIGLPIWWKRITG